MSDKHKYAETVAHVTQLFDAWRLVTEELVVIKDDLKEANDRISEMTHELEEKILNVIDLERQLELHKTERDQAVKLLGDFGRDRYPIKEFLASIKKD